MSWDEDAATLQHELADLVKHKPPVSRSRVQLITKIANDNVAHASQIADIIERFVSKAPSQYRLSGLYLIDSICKKKDGSGGVYRPLFSQRMEAILRSALEAEKDRESAKRVVSLWAKGEVFTIDQLQRWAHLIKEKTGAAPDGIKPVAPSLDVGNVFQQQIAAAAAQPQPGAGGIQPQVLLAALAQQGGLAALLPGLQNGLAALLGGAAAAPAPQPAPAPAAAVPAAFFDYDDDDDDDDFEARIKKQKARVEAEERRRREEEERQSREREERARLAAAHQQQLQMQQNQPQVQPVVENPFAPPPAQQQQYQPPPQQRQPPVYAPQPPPHLPQYQPPALQVQTASQPHHQPQQHQTAPDDPFNPQFNMGDPQPHRPPQNFNQRGPAAQGPPSTQQISVVEVVPDPSVPDGFQKVATQTLFAGNLSPGVTDLLLYAVFSQYGSLIAMKHHADKHFAFMSFQTRAESENAKQVLHGALLDGRELKVGWANPFGDEFEFDRIRGHSVVSIGSVPRFTPNPSSFRFIDKMKRDLMRDPTLAQRSLQLRPGGSGEESRGMKRKYDNEDSGPSKRGKYENRNDAMQLQAYDSNAGSGGSYDRNYSLSRGRGDADRTHDSYRENRYSSSRDKSYGSGRDDDFSVPMSGGR